MIDIAMLLRLELSMYLLIGLGILLRRKNFLDAQAEAFLSKLTLNLVLPCSIIKSFLIELNGEILRQFLVVLVAASGVAVMQIAVGRLAFGFLPPERRKIMQYGMINANSAFLGYPLMEGLFGAPGLAQASIYMIPNRIMIWTVGLGLFAAQGVKGKAVLKKCLLHPCMVALYVGLFFLLTQCPMPGFIEDSLKMMSNCLTALSMILIGSILAKVSMRGILRPEVLLFCAVRLLVLPGLMFAACKLLALDALTSGVCVVMCAMPAASITAILARQYGADSETAGLVVTLSTALSTVTIPLWGILLSTL